VKEETGVSNPAGNLESERNEGANMTVTTTTPSPRAVLPKSEERRAKSEERRANV